MPATPSFRTLHHPPCRRPAVLPAVVSTLWLTAALMLCLLGYYGGYYRGRGYGSKHVNWCLNRYRSYNPRTNTYTGYQTSKPHYLAHKLIIPLIQVGGAKETELPDTPLLLDLDVKPGDKPLIEYMSKAITVGRPVGTTPGVPPERVAALRRAFDLTFQDPEFIAEAKQQNAEVRPMTGEMLARIIRELIEAPQDVRDRVKIALEPKAADLGQTR